MKPILLCCFALGLLVGCAAFRTACPVIDLASEGCHVFNVKLPDGTIEQVPTEDVTKAAMHARDVRLSRVSDAGATGD